MTRRKKRIISIITLLVTLLFVVPMSLVAYYLQPSVITPIINTTASNYLKTDLSFGSVELDLVSSYPNVEVRLIEGKLLSLESLKDTTIFPTTDLISFQRLDIVLNAYDILFNKKLTISSLQFLKPEIYFAVDPQGVANWNILNESSQEVDTTEQTLMFDLAIDQLNIEDASMVFDDRLNRLYTRTLDYSLALNGNFSAANSLVNADMKAYKSLMWREDKLLADNVNLGVIVDMIGDSTTNSLTLRNGIISFDNIKVNMNGYLAVDTVNINLEAHTNTLDRIIKRIPTNIIDTTHKFTSTGDISLAANIAGRFQNGVHPIIKGEFNVDNASFKYEGFSQGVEDAHLYSNFIIDANQPSRSALSLKSFAVEAGSNSLEIVGQVTDLHTNPMFSSYSNIKLDFDEIKEFIPLQDSIQLSGEVVIDGATSITMEQLMKQDFARTFADARVSLDSLIVLMPKDSVDIWIRSVMLNISNNSEGLLMADATLWNTNIHQSQTLNTQIDTLYAQMQGEISSDSTAYIAGKIEAKDIDFALHGDTLSLYSPQVSMDTHYSPILSSVDINTDSLALKYYGDSVILKRARIDLDYADSLVNGTISFNRLRAFVAGFRKPIVFSKAKIRSVDSDIYMDNLNFRVGKSQATMTGTVSNLLASVRGEGGMLVRSKLSSDLINFSQLSQLYDPSLTTIDTTQVADTDNEDRVFVIPQMADLELELDVKRAVFDSLDMTNIRGDMIVNNSIMKLEALGLNAVGAEIRSSLEYSTSGDTTAHSRFMLMAEKINVGQAVKILPMIDSVMPMMKSLSGTLSLNISASVDFDSTMVAQLPTLNSAVRIEGKNLTMADGDMLDEISKTLRFKKNDSKVIDSLRAEILIDNGVANVLPFRLDINRYSLAIGGTHSFDQHIDYHISVLKSQVPFKMGINVTGTVDSMKIGIGKTKYKDLESVKDNSVAYPQYLERWNKLTQGLRIF